MLLFCRGQHGLVHKCVLRVQHAYFSTLDQSKFSICGFVFPVAVVDVKAPYFCNKAGEKTRKMNLTSFSFLYCNVDCLSLMMLSLFLSFYIHNNKIRSVFYSLHFLRVKYLSMGIIAERTRVE